VTNTPVDSGTYLGEVLAATDLALLVWQLHAADDPGGMELLYATPASRSLTLREVDDAVGLTMREVFPSADRYPQISQYAEVALGAQARDMGDVEIHQEPYGPATYAVKIYPIPGRRVAVVARDVTRHRRATTDVVNVLNSISDAFFVYDDQWRYTFVNSGGERLAQTSKEKMLGQCVWDVFPQVVGTPVEQTMLRAAREKTTSYTEAQPAYSDAWYSLWAYPTTGGVAVYMQDITELKRLEEQLQQAQKMDAVARLAGTIAHDFNNALTAIRAAASLAIDAMDDSAARADVARIDDIAAHAAALTEQLLTIARSQPLPASPTSVHHTLADLRSLVSSLVTEATSLATDFDASADVVLIDPSQLRQVVLNLVLNARDAMTTGGTIRLSTRNLDFTEGSTLAQELHPAMYVVLTCSDTGCGMSEEVLARAMEPFFTTSPDGTGLGLTSVFGIAQQAGGYVEMTSAVGEGTSVSVVLPTTEVPPSDTRRDTTPSPKGTATILLVEDDDDVRPLLARALTRLGYHLIVTASGEEAVAAAGEAGEDIDLVLTDVLMPGMTGGELVDHLKRTQPTLKALFMSGYAADELARRGIGDAAFYVQKPFQVGALAERISTALES
jgi:signal transduction histidine kinase